MAVVTADRPIWLKTPSAPVYRSATTLSRLVREFQELLADLDPFNRLITELDALLMVEDYNGFRARIEQPIRDRALRYLTDARNAGAPIPELTPDGEGGIEIEWEYQGRHLAANFSADGNGDFLSWREPNGRYEGDRSNDNLFADRLEWLTRR